MNSDRIVILSEKLCSTAGAAEAAKVRKDLRGEFVRGAIAGVKHGDLEYTGWCVRQFAGLLGR
jgi:hypothetical protein